MQKPTFQQKDLDTEIILMQQRIKQHEAILPVVAMNKIREQLYGKEHPYGYHFTQQNLAAITIDDVRDYYAKNAWRNPACYVSGDVNDRVLTMIEDSLKTIEKKPKLEVQHTLVSNPKRNVTLHRSGVQAVLVQAHHTIPRHHPDFHAFKCVTKLLGGFFGSRLMQNIREDKGYTYGINTYFQHFRHHTAWVLSTSIKANVVEATREEIRKEIKRLQTTPVVDEELFLLKKYMCGELINFFDNPIHIDSILLSLALGGLDFSFYNNLYQTIKEITPATIQKMAQTYLAPEELYQVVVMPQKG